MQWLGTEPIPDHEQRGLTCRNSKKQQKLPLPNFLCVRTVALPCLPPRLDMAHAATHARTSMPTSIAVFQ